VRNFLIFAVLAIVAAFWVATPHRHGWESVVLGAIVGLTAYMIRKRS
jgi:hypothetical protein